VKDIQAEAIWAKAQIHGSSKDTAKAGSV